MANITYGKTSVSDIYLKARVRVSKYGTGRCNTSHIYRAEKKDMNMISARHQTEYKE